jgi:DNA-binding transcriptional MerR regulator
MDERTRTFTIDELERLSGIDRRTIAYYVQEGVLPKIGRRGPRTRYPQLFLDRLLFIKRQREREEAGELEGTMTLAEIRGLFDREEAATIAAAVREPESPPPPPEAPEPWPQDALEIAAEADAPFAADESEPVMEMRYSMPPAGMSSFVQRAKRMMRGSSERKSEPVERREMAFLGAASQPLEEEVLLEEAPAESAAIEQEPVEHELAGLLAQLDESAGSRPGLPHRGSEHWTRASVTPNLTVSARNLDEDDAFALERLADLLRRLLQRRRR